MPATQEARAQVFLEHLEGCFPRRLGITLEELATWLAGAFGIKDSTEVCRRKVTSLETQLGKPALLGKRRIFPLIDLAFYLAAEFDTTSETDTALASRPRTQHITDRSKQTRSSRQDFLSGSMARRARPSTAGFMTLQDLDGTETVWTWLPEPESVDELPHFSHPSTRILHEQRVSQVRNFWIGVERELRVILAKDRADTTSPHRPTRSKTKVRKRT